jgi:hypothetical protein
MRTALPESRLETRRDRVMRGAPFGTGQHRVPRNDQIAVLSADRARWRAVDLYGTSGIPAWLARMRVRACAVRVPFRSGMPTVVQLASGVGGRHRLQPRVLAASRCPADRAAQKAGGTYSGVSVIAMQDASLQDPLRRPPDFCRYMTTSHTGRPRSFPNSAPTNSTTRGKSVSRAWWNSKQGYAGTRKA